MGMGFRASGRGGCEHCCDGRRVIYALGGLRVNYVWVFREVILARDTQDPISPSVVGVCSVSDWW